MNLEEIERAIPHRRPFLLIDEIVLREPGHIVCRKTFSADESWYRGHFPHFPVTPGVLLCETAMQAGAVLVSAEYGAAGRHDREISQRVPVVTRIDDARFRQMVRPGQTVTADVRLIEKLGGAFFLDAKVLVDEKTAVRFRFACTLAETGDGLRGK
jgi:3-hydroxyacyl-[acyl-carrier-protein] dehydratase